MFFLAGVHHCALNISAVNDGARRNFPRTIEVGANRFPCALVRKSRCWKNDPNSFPRFNWLEAELNFFSHSLTLSDPPQMDSIFSASKSASMPSPSLRMWFGTANGFEQ